MAKRKKEQEPKKKETVVFRITVTHGLEIRDYLITAEYYDTEYDDSSIAHFYKGDDEMVASFRHWIAIENLRDAEAWGERFEKLAKTEPVQGDMFEKEEELLAKIEG